MSKKYCKHVFEYVYSATCPYCGKDTHEPDIELQSKLFKEYYKSGKHLQWICPIDGGTIKGWESI